jgi:predicted RNA-binding protein with TRAM domain
MGGNAYHFPHRSYRRDWGEKPVKVGDRVRVEISSTGKEGDGLAQYKGLVIFVPGARVGETHDIEIMRIGRTTAVGKIAGAAQ